MSAFRALQAPSFRRFFVAQSFSLTGYWLAITAGAWLAYDLTGDAFSLGLVVFAQQLPVLLLAPLAGVLGDRLDRRRLFIALQTTCVLHAATLAVLSFSGHLTFSLLIALAVLRGLVNAAEWPTRQSLNVDLVGNRAHLASAIALNSSLFNLARMIGPAAAGLLIAQAHVGWCYAFDALSCLPNILVMLFNLASRNDVCRPHTHTGPRSHPLLALREGFAYAARDPGLRSPLLLIALTGFSGFAAGTLAPLIARDLLHGDARLLGLLNTAVGIGAVASALALGTTRMGPENLERWVGRGALLLAIGQGICALSPAPALTLTGMTVCGVGIVLTYAGANTLVQLRVDDARRSRVMGLYTTAQSVYPLGGLATGITAASALGPRLTIAVQATLCFLGGLVFLGIARARAGKVTPLADVAKPAVNNAPKPLAAPAVTS